MRRFAFLYLLFLASCGPSISNICQDIADCEDDQDGLDRCIDEGEAIEKAADEAGCSGEFNDFIDCIDDTFECKDKDTDFDCRAEENALEDCGVNL